METSEPSSEESETSDTEPVEGMRPWDGAASPRRRRDLRAATSDAYNSWAGPVAAGWRPRIHPPWHRHIALFTA